MHTNEIHIRKRLNKPGSYCGGNRGWLVDAPRASTCADCIRAWRKEAAKKERRSNG